jgi:hypothetical protein
VQPEVVLRWFKKELVNNTVSAESAAQVPPALLEFYENLKQIHALPAPTPPTEATRTSLLVHQNSVNPLKKKLEELRDVEAKRTWSLRVQTDRLERLAKAQQAFDQSWVWRITRRLHRGWMLLTGQSKQPTPMDKIKAILSEQDDL